MSAGKQREVDKT